jgi:hypothetical protein
MNDVEKHLESVLSREPDFKLPTAFADRVANSIEVSRQKERRLEVILISVGAFSFLAALVVTIVLTDFKISFAAFPFIASNIGLIVFGAAFVLLLNYLDKKLVKNAA